MHFFSISMFLLLAFKITFIYFSNSGRIFFHSSFFPLFSSPAHIFAVSNSFFNSLSLSSLLLFSLLSLSPPFFLSLKVLQAFSSPFPLLIPPLNLLHEEEKEEGEEEKLERVVSELCSSIQAMASSRTRPTLSSLSRLHNIEVEKEEEELVVEVCISPFLLLLLLSSSKQAHKKSVSCCCCCRAYSPRAIAAAAVAISCRQAAVTAAVSPPIRSCCYIRLLLSSYYV